MKKIFNNLIKNKTSLIIFVFGVFILLTSIIFMIWNMVDFKDNVITENTTKLLMKDVLKNFSSFFYFTYQSNIILGIALILVALFIENKKYLRFLFSATTLITITFIIYWALISWTNDWNDVPESIRSIITHAINPILGFVALFLIKEKVLVDRKLFIHTGFYVLGYFFFGFILYFATYDYIVKNTGATIYSFLNFNKPLFYSGGNLALIIFLDLIMFIIALTIPFGLAYFWKWAYKIKIDNKKCYFLDIKNKMFKK
ncbi:MAGa3780 family membrane protein [Mesomycoplasma lagogenitalium]|uniref:Uncharacterized protein n=1 Tax=Mesomycoplasma lagogenitalium TaxID=171286 RepID=A0ABY8LSV5_9BACT|nr:hypothetical protein [Mesomycoplasma lagogenitalium]WGI36332.1 hypothetical protein QEG99_02535 [Mesomycoplasma lagogenitalium]